MTGVEQHWLWVPEPRPQAEVRLVCLPPAGADGTTFGDLCGALPENIELCSIRLPGRGARSGEEPVRDVHELAAILSAVLTRSASAPIALFGASLGGFVAFEVAHRLAPTNTVAALLTYGTPAPHLQRRKDESLLEVDDAALAEALVANSVLPFEVSANAELLELVLPAMRVDYDMAATYRTSARCPLGVPLHAFVGSADTSVSIAEVEAWSLHAGNGFTMTPMSGGHLWSDATVLGKAISKVFSATPPTAPSATNRPNKGENQW